MRLTRRRTGHLAAVLVPLMVAALCGIVLFNRAVDSADAREVASAPVTPAPRKAVTTGWINGVDLARYKDLGPFVKATGEHPQVVGIYVRLGDPFPIAEVKTIERSGAVPLIQMLPRNAHLAAVAGGSYDSYLRAWAAAARRGGPVILSLAHEMNGPWFSWGCGHTPARVFIAAWRHVHEVIGTSGITWLFNVNEGWRGAPCKMLSRWPGSPYVNWVGLDGYLHPYTSSFDSGIGFSIRYLQARTRKPVLLAEGGVQIGPGDARRMMSLYTGARRAHCLGIIYFDSATRKGDYRPQDSPAALAAFRRAIGLPG